MRYYRTDTKVLVRWRSWRLERQVVRTPRLRGEIDRGVTYRYVVIDEDRIAERVHHVADVDEEIAYAIVHGDSGVRMRVEHEACPEYSVSGPCRDGRCKRRGRPRKWSSGSHSADASEEDAVTHGFGIESKCEASLELASKLATHYLDRPWTTSCGKRVMLGRMEHDWTQVTCLPCHVMHARRMGVPT